MCKHPEATIAPIISEFYANMCRDRDKTIFVLGKWLPFDKKVTNAYYKSEEKSYEEFQALAQQPNYDTILQRLTEGTVSWKHNQSGQIVFFLAKGLSYLGKL